MGIGKGLLVILLAGALLLAVGLGLRLQGGAAGMAAASGEAERVGVLQAPPPAWRIETVDGPGDVGRYASLVLDGGDHPRVAYCMYDAGSLACDDLKYARWDGADWIADTVDATGLVGEYSSLALDSSGQPRIAYCLYGSGTCDDLRYVRWTGSGWFRETVDSAGNVGRYASLALDSADHPHISYRDDTSDALKYAHHDGVGWILAYFPHLSNRIESTTCPLDGPDQWLGARTAATKGIISLPL